MKTIHQKYDHIKVNNKYYQCICADKDTAVFAPLIKRNECLSAVYKNLFAVPNDLRNYDFEFDKARLIQWDGSSIKKITPINNSLGTEINGNRALKIKTKKGLLIFKVGQYINYVNKEVQKP